MTNPDDRQRMLTQTRNLKMAQSAHAYVRGSTVEFYEWLESTGRGGLPEGPSVWICGDCHVGNLVPLVCTKLHIWSTAEHQHLTAEVLQHRRHRWPNSPLILGSALLSDVQMKTEE